MHLLMVLRRLTLTREDPVIKALLEKAKEEFIENKYNQ